MDWCLSTVCVIGGPIVSKSSSRSLAVTMILKFPSSTGRCFFSSSTFSWELSFNHTSAKRTTQVFCGGISILQYAKFSTVQFNSLHQQYRNHDLAPIPQKRDKHRPVDRRIIRIIKQKIVHMLTAIQLRAYCF